jgi:hypothetical protein
MLDPIAQPASETPPSICGDNAHIGTTTQLQLAAPITVTVDVGQESDAAGPCDLGIVAARATDIAHASEHRHRSPRMGASSSARSKAALPLISYVRSGAGSSGDSTSNLSPADHSVHLLPAADGVALFRAALESQVCALPLPGF